LKLQKKFLYLKVYAIILILVRFLSLPFNVLTDSTEARYAEMGRKMFETGNYITPFIDSGVPFWGKPPLSFWSTALSYKIFGVNEFAAHLPHFLFLLGVVLLVFFFTRKYFDSLTAHISMAVILSCTLFLYYMGSVMTDPAFTFALTLSFVAFYSALYSEKNRTLWGYTFFAGLGMGLLAKGPLCLVFIGFTLFFWILLTKKWKEVWDKIPWFTGTLLMLLIALPWYIMAENQTPGFLKYFIIGEHFERYTIPDWSGDLYGDGRGGFKGIIWLFYFVALLPWSLIGLVYFISKCIKRTPDSKFPDFSFLKNEKLLYIFLWILGPLLLFTFSSNTLITYTLPILAPASIFAGYYISKNSDKINKKIFTFVFYANIIIFLLLIPPSIVYLLKHKGPLGQWVESTAAKSVKSDKFIIDEYFEHCPQKDCPLLYMASKRYSTDFYSRLESIQILYDDEISPYLKKYPVVYLVVNNKQYRNGNFEKTHNAEVLLKALNRVLLKIPSKDYLEKPHESKE